MQVQRRRPTTTSAPADLEHALFDLGIEVAKADDDEVWAKCPLHSFYTGKDDNNPSWSVNRMTGYHSCFSCPFGGSFLYLVREVLNVGQWDALRWVKGYGLNLDAIEALPEYEERHTRASKAERVTEDDLLQFRSPPDEALAIRSITRASAQRFGLLWDGVTSDWILPIRLRSGELLGWQRKNEKRFGGDGAVKNFPRRVPKSVTMFGAHIFPVGAPAVVLEGPLDPPRLHSAGMEGGLATWGDKFSDEQMRLLRDLTDEVVWASDNDEAGRSAARMFRDGDPKTKRPAYVRRFNSRFLNYEMLPGSAKDIGEPECEDIHILRAVRTAQHPLFADLGVGIELDRGTASVPDEGPRRHGGARARPGGVRAGVPYRRQRRNSQPFRRK